MIVSVLKITVDPGKKDEILEVLLSVKGPIEAEPGCMGCHIFQDLLNERMIYYNETWQNRGSLFAHIRSDRYRTLIAVMEMSSEAPDIKFKTVTNTKGMELIREAIGSIGGG